MARAGVYVWDVKRARDTLLARGSRPSIDAVRAELGNTGSKTTIHKYLRELEAEEGAQNMSISDTLQKLVSQLAEQLKAEANVTVAAVRSELANDRTANGQRIGELQSVLDRAQEERDAVSRQLGDTQQQVKRLQQLLIDEELKRRSSEQRAQELLERLSIAERHQASLEEKHQHARQALDHFRVAAKEQRDQENARHQHQLNSMQAELRQAQMTGAQKQEQLTQLNKEAAALAAELAANKQVVYLEREGSRALGRKVEQLHVIEVRAAALENQVAEARAQVAKAQAELAVAQETSDELRQQVAALHATNIATGGTKQLEQQIIALQNAVFGKE